MVAARKLWQWAKEANDAGDVFPIHGTCLGFQLLVRRPAGAAAAAPGSREASGALLPQGGAVPPLPCSQPTTSLCCPAPALIHSTS